MERIKSNMERNNTDENIVKQQKVKDSLKNWQKMLESQGSLYQVLEWKDENGKTIIYIYWIICFYFISGGALDRRRLLRQKGNHSNKKNYC